MFFVTTSDPDLNVARIANRVARGGHSVEPEATRRRYRAAMDLLACAVEHADIAVVVDNSGREPSTVAIKNRGNLQEPGTDQAQWAVEKLIQPCQERLASLQKIESALSAQGVLREASKPDVADADASNGRQYIGAILELTRYHALQQTGENTYIVHDRSLIATTVLRKGERTTIAYVYDKGKILALHR
ncbi:MAG: hypothetical protein LBM17_01170 [Candidatus Accumulibacter sp.]|nr:hypothetical protein [Accumulibacter sp.]